MKMRDIKFRAWDIKNKCMTAISSISFKAGEIWCCGYPAGQGKYEHEMVLEEAVLMQFTGLKSKNGLDIYEGDIIDDDVNCLHWIVKYSEHLCKFYLDPTRSGRWLDFETEIEYRVVGNIFSNPELLK